MKVLPFSRAARVRFAGLPALRFAVIRRALELLLLELGSEPARLYCAAILYPSVTLKTHASFCFDFCQFSPSQLCLPLCASDRDADVQLDRSHALAPLWSIARLLHTGSAAGASCAA